MTDREKAIEAIREATTISERCAAIKQAMRVGVLMSVIRDLLDAIERGEA